MGRILLVAATAALGFWMCYIALQIKQDGKVRYGSTGQRVRYEDALDPDRFLELTRRYHLLIGSGFIGIAIAAWLIASPVIVMFLYLIYAAGINFARAAVENRLMTPVQESEGNE
ncbi:hypothetical protein [Acidaminobacter hydrogenoformans]|uniref:Uncharacterized protein n=1 Tax=Acidaminobacter hydrogenoformans DSM 2784 TaxID=1120920 RepID=A0A1G5S7D3_9FIRM|nr:hypothetical protein [Acidaminobacter hydrogenoformans]SCZ81499.1 hypothetical protein SAMN03080599_02824 [Acidaminobacter hydrogenoformans DSM 2784]